MAQAQRRVPGVLPQRAAGAQARAVRGHDAPRGRVLVAQHAAGAGGAEQEVVGEELERGGVRGVLLCGGGEEKKERVSKRRSCKQPLPSAQLLPEGMLKLNAASAHLQAVHLQPPLVVDVRVPPLRRREKLLAVQELDGSRRLLDLQFVVMAV